MIRFIARRFLETIPVLFIIATATFFMMRLAPGGPFDAEKQASKEVRARMEAHYGLDKPLFAQYLLQMKHLLQGDLGPSFKYPSRTVNEIIADAFPVSLELGIEALAVALVFGLAAGMTASLNQNSVLGPRPDVAGHDWLVRADFCDGAAADFRLRAAPGLVQRRRLVFPARPRAAGADAGRVYAAYIARLARGGLLEVLNQDYHPHRAAKGAGGARILFKHALRGGMLPVVSFLGPAMAGLLTGSFVVETIFGIPGLGRFFVTAAFNRDYFMVMGSVLFYAVFVVALNLAVDVVLVWLNPKLRFE
jgi:oligopeptide transport system permease protein